MVPLSINPLNSAGQRNTEYYVPLGVSPKFAHSRTKSSSSNPIKFAFSSLEIPSPIRTKFGAILFPCLRRSLEGPIMILADSIPTQTRAKPSSHRAHKDCGGLIFSTQGYLKYIDPNIGVVRFARIGFPHSYFTAHFVGHRDYVRFACSAWILGGGRRAYHC